MSKENVVTFYEQHVLKTPSLEAELAGAKSREEFATIALAAGSKAGLSFTKEDLGTVMAATERKVGGQLSDEQLEGVVGGANTNQANVPTIQIKNLPATQKPVVVNPGAVHADTVGCCW
jgi:hypothetical protein